MRKKKDNHQKRFSTVDRCRSFLFAYQGLKMFFTTQHNAWLHSVATVVVVSAGFFFKLNLVEWTLVIFAIGLVFTAELLNTAIEFLTDIVSPDYNEKAGKVKDIAAAGVLIAAITAFAVGCIVFLPKII